MSEQRLHDLLHDAVSDVAPDDDLGIERAWREGTRARRRRTTVQVALAAAAVVAVVGGAVALLDPRSAPAGPAGHAPGATSSSGTVAGADATYRGAPVWWSPTPAAEERLDLRQTNLPATFDLAADAPPVATEPVRRAAAAFVVYAEDGSVAKVLVVTPAGTYRTVDVSQVSPHNSDGSNRAIDATASMLSPGGDYLAFSNGRLLWVLRMATGKWLVVQTHSKAGDWTVRWLDDHTIALPHQIGYDLHRRAMVPTESTPGPSPAGFGATEWYDDWIAGPGTSARSGYLGTDAPVSRGTATPPQALVVARGSQAPSVLEFTESLPKQSRQKQCCSAVGWLDGSTVVYQSIGADPALVAWQVDSHEFFRVSRITGVRYGSQTFVASYARMWSQ